MMWLKEKGLLTHLPGTCKDCIFVPRSATHLLYNRIIPWSGRICKNSILTVGKQVHTLALHRGDKFREYCLIDYNQILSISGTSALFSFRLRSLIFIILMVSRLPCSSACSYYGEKVECCSLFLKLGEGWKMLCDCLGYWVILKILHWGWSVNC